MIAFADRRASVSTQVRSPDLPYWGGREEEAEQTAPTEDFCRVGAQAQRIGLPVMSGGHKPQRYGKHAAYWSYATETPSATALVAIQASLALVDSLTCFDVDHFFPKSVVISAVSTAPCLSGVSEDLLACLSKVYALESAKRHRAASKVIFAFTERRFAKSDLASVNQLLANIDVEKLSVWSISGLLRVTARAKSWLPVWPTRLRDAKKTLSARGEKDLDTLFVGL